MSPTPRPDRAGAEPAEISRVRARFERLLAAGVEIFSQHSLTEVLQSVVDTARDVVGARYAALGVLDERGAALDAFVTSGMTPEDHARIGALPRGQGLLGLVIREQRAIRTPDIMRHPARSGFPPNHPPMHSFLGVPIVARGKVFGNLYLTEKIGAEVFDAEDEAIAGLLAGHAAVAVENARLHDASGRLLAQVQGMQRQRDLFFAMMNHELRNALTGVYGWAERLVRGKSQTPEALTRAGREVYEAAERTITLLNNFLDLTRLDSGKVRPVWREVEIRAVVERALAGMRPAADARRVTLEEHYPDPLPPFRTDPLRLEQILVNLLSNAIRHTAEGTSVILRIDRTEQGLEFRVRDHGPGVPVELKTRVFEPFERFDPHSGIGTGLGLPVSSRLAEVMGGHLGVEDAPGPGATFLLTLPAGPSEK